MLSIVPVCQAVSHRCQAVSHRCQALSRLCLQRMRRHRSPCGTTPGPAGQDVLRAHRGRAPHARRRLCRAGRQRSRTGRHPYASIQHCTRPSRHGHDRPRGAPRRCARRALAGRAPGGTAAGRAAGKGRGAMVVEAHLNRGRTSNFAFSREGNTGMKIKTHVKAGATNGDIVIGPPPTSTGSAGPGTSP